MADAFAQFGILLKEFISPGARNLMLPDDDPIHDMIGAMEGETKGGRREHDGSTGYPSGYEVRYKIKTQRSGRVAGGRFGGNTLQMVGAGANQAVGQDISAGYLDPRKTPLSAYIHLALILRRVLVSSTLTEQQILARLVDSPVEDVASDVVEDVVTRYRRLLANYFYSNGTGTLATITNAESVAEGAQTVVELATGTFYRFDKGDRVQAGTNANPSVQRTGNINGEMVVVSVDPDGRTISLESVPGEGTISLTAGDALKLLGTYDYGGASDAVNSRAAEGYKSLLLSTGVYPGTTSAQFTSGLNVAQHTELKSFVQTNSTNEDPTPESLALILDKIRFAAKNMPTAMIADPSIWTLYAQLERENGAMYQVPQGAAFQASGGVAKPVYTHMQYRFQLFDSMMIDPNVILGLSPMTWKKFIPLGDRTIRWKYGSGIRAGFPSIYGPTFNGYSLSETVDAPGESAIQFGCLEPRANFYISGVRSQRDT